MVGVAVQIDVVFGQMSNCPSLGHLKTADCGDQPLRERPLLCSENRHSCKNMRRAHVGRYTNSVYLAYTEPACRLL